MTHFSHVVVKSGASLENDSFSSHSTGRLTLYFIEVTSDVYQEAVFNLEIFISVPARQLGYL